MTKPSMTRFGPVFFFHSFLERMRCVSPTFVLFLFQFPADADAFVIYSFDLFSLYLVPLLSTLYAFCSFFEEDSLRCFFIQFFYSSPCFLLCLVPNYQMVYLINMADSWQKKSCPSCYALRGRECEMLFEAFIM